MQRKIFTKVSFNQDDLKYHVVFWLVLHYLHWFNIAFTYVDILPGHLFFAFQTTYITFFSTVLFSYINTYWLLTKTIGNEKINLWLAIIIYFVSALFLALLGSKVFEYLHDIKPFFDTIAAREAKYSMDFTWTRTFPEAVFNMFLLTGLVYIRKWFHNFEMLRIQNVLLEKENEVLEKSQQVNTYRIKSLNQQIKPHFTFNALNHIYLKSLQNPTAVPEIVERFSDALEYITYDCMKDKVPLIKELEFIERFISIELQGLNNKTYQLDVVIDKNFDKNLEITPLLLIVLVENGIKYGIKKTDNGKFMKLKIKVKNENELSFSMENSQPTEMGGIELHASGIGIRNMRERLKEFYQNKHKLELNSKNDIFETKLKIQLL